LRNFEGLKLRKFFIGTTLAVSLLYTIFVPKQTQATTHKKNAMKYIAYYRVSTKGQGESGLGLEAQQTSVLQHLKPGDEIIGEFKDIESGKNRNRKGLQAAMQLCKKENAVLLVAKLDRLGRDAEMIFNLMNSGLSFQVCDLPGADFTTIGFMAVLAERERAAISKRTKDAYEAKKLRLAKVAEAASAMIELGHEYLLKSIADAAYKSMTKEQKASVMIALTEDVKNIIKCEVDKNKNKPHHHVLKCESGHFQMTFGEGKMKYQPSEKQRVDAMKSRIAKAKQLQANRTAYHVIKAGIEKGKSANEIKNELNDGGFKTRHGKDFHTVQVINLARFMSGDATLFSRQMKTTVSI